MSQVVQRERSRSRQKGSPDQSAQAKSKPSKHIRDDQLPKQNTLLPAAVVKLQPKPTAVSTAPPPSTVEPSAPTGSKASKQLSYQEYVQKENQFHDNQQLLRAFMRIEQNREQPIDKFIKMVYAYKDKLKFDRNLMPILNQPKHYLGTLTLEQLKAMLPQAAIHSKIDKSENNQYVEFWTALTQLINYKIARKTAQKVALKPEFKEKIKLMINKPLPKLEQLQESIQKTLKGGVFGIDVSYWENILTKVRGRKYEAVLIRFAEDFLSHHEEDEAKQPQVKPERTIITSPILGAQGTIPQRLITTDEQDFQMRKELANKIFQTDFEKGKARLEQNLSLPKDHNILAASVTEDANPTQQFIAGEILQFERYKRLEDDEQVFNDWMPVETEGRFRDRKPIYVNRVRMLYEWNKYNKTHYSSENPPPKITRGYKFNIFYPDLWDKTKTPQYFLENCQNPNYCIIRFKAGPPYLDVAFRIVKREWDFSKKSGFESVFQKGILHLYFNFKRARYRM